MQNSNQQVMDAEMKQDLEQIEKLVAAVDTKVTGIIAFLRGNELDKEDKGLVGRVNEIERRTENLEKWRDRIFWALIGMGLPAGVGTWELVKSIFLHQ
jgi:hypothetical protein